MDINILNVNSPHIAERWKSGTAWWLRHGHPQTCFYCKNPTWLFQELWYVGGMTDMIVHKKCYFDD